MQIFFATMPIGRVGRNGKLERVEFNEAFAMNFDVD